MNTKSVYKISYGLFVLTASEGDKDNGCIINTLMQLTSSPMQIAVTVNKANLTHDMIKNTGKFNVSVIDRTADFSLFKHFGFQSGRDAQKFGTPDSYKFTPHYSDNGLLYIKAGTNAFMSGKVVNEIDLGTHTMFIAEMTDGEILSDNPSMTYEYYQANVKPKPAAPKKTGWVCKICGYIYEGEVLPEDFVCPICKHGAVDFEKLQ
ncbi:MAG: flavin reductase [Oscillospiraceae bacterium]